MNLLEKLIRDIMNLDYVSNLSYTNNADKSEKLHEKKAKSVLDDDGFEEISFDAFLKIEYPEMDMLKKTKRESIMTNLKKRYRVAWTKTQNFLGKKVYIHQPFGSQCAPDFIVIENNRMIYLELKSTKKNKIQFNSGIPLEDEICIFSSAKFKSTCMMGSDVFPPDVKLELQKRRTEDKLNAEITNAKLKEMHNPLGIQTYPRQMNIPTISPFNNPLNCELEDKVFNYLKGLYV